MRKDSAKHERAGQRWHDRERRRAERQAAKLAKKEQDDPSTDPKRAKGQQK